MVGMEEEHDLGVSQATEEDGTKKPSTNSIDLKPWKYLGYPAFSKYLTQDPDCLVVRRFSPLFGRCLLYLQYQVTKRGEELDELDQRCINATDEAPEYSNGTIRGDFEERKEAIQACSRALKDFYDLMLAYSRVASLKAPDQRAVNNVQTWLFTNHPGAILPAEADFINHRSDLVSLLGEDKPVARRLFEDGLVLRSAVLRSLFRKRDVDRSLECDVDRQTQSHVSDEHIRRFYSYAVFVAGLAMFVAPLWILHVLGSPSLKLLVITLFVVGFMFILTSSTLGRPLETLAATAGYSAVLVVFLQFGSSQIAACPA